MLHLSLYNVKLKKNKFRSGKLKIIIKQTKITHSGSPGPDRKQTKETYILVTSWGKGSVLKSILYKLHL